MTTPCDAVSGERATLHPLGITGSFAVGMPEHSGSGIADPRVPGESYSYTQTTQQFMQGRF